MEIMRCLRGGLPLIVAGLLTLGASIGTGLLLTLGTGDAVAQEGTGTDVTNDIPDLPVDDTVFVNEEEAQGQEVIELPDDSSCEEPDAETIQEGVDEANDGDEVVVCEGTYEESVTVNKSITVRTESDPEFVDGDCEEDGEVTVDPDDDDSGSAFSLEADDIELRGFVVTGAEGAGIATSSSHAGYLVEDNLVVGNVFGLYLNSDGLDPTTVGANCFVDNNEAGSASGNGIYSDQGLGQATVDENQFVEQGNAGITLAGQQSNINVVDNTSEDGSLLAAFNTSATEISGNTVTGNEFSAIFLSSGDDLNVNNNEITGGGGSGIILAGASASVTDNDMAGDLFDGIRLTTSDPDFDGDTEDGEGSTNNTVEDNTVTGAGRDGIRVTEDSEGNTLTDNSALITNDSTGVDCRDQSSGDGTAGTANTWTGNTGDTDDPEGICTPSSGGDDGDGGNPGGGNGSSNGGGNGNGSNDNDNDDPEVFPPPLGGVLGARNDCALFRQNFGGPDNATQLARCVAATSLVIESVAPFVVTPVQACQGLSKRRPRGFRRSDYGACVRAIQLTQAGLGRIL